MQPKVKLTVEVTPQEYEGLEQLAEERGVSKTIALRQAIRDEVALRGYVAQGAKVLIREGKDYREVLLT